MLNQIRFMLNKIKYDNLIEPDKTQNDYNCTKYFSLFCNQFVYRNFATYICVVNTCNIYNYFGQNLVLEEGKVGPFMLILVQMTLS